MPKAVAQSRHQGEILDDLRRLQDLSINGTQVGPGVDGGYRGETRHGLSGDVSPRSLTELDSGVEIRQILLPSGHVPALHGRGNLGEFLESFGPLSPGSAWIAPLEML